MLSRAFTAWVVTFNFRGRRIMTLFYCSSISCYYSSRERADSLKGRNSHSCADSPLPYLSFASCTLCIISRSFSPRNAYYLARLSGRLLSRFQSFFNSFVFFLLIPRVPPLVWANLYVYLAKFNKTWEAMLFLSHVVNSVQQRIIENFWYLLVVLQSMRLKLQRVSNHNRMRDVTRD